MQFFQLFGIAPQFSIDAPALTRKFLWLQTENHPDKFVTSDPASLRLAQQKSALINDAYSTLIIPVSRAAYLIKNRYDVEPFSETNTKIPRDFLEKQMEIHEAIIQHRHAKDSVALEHLLTELEDDVAFTEGALSRSLDVAPNKENAIEAARMLKFQSKLLEEITEAIY